MSIKLAIFDVDGVLTNGQLFYLPTGEGKAFHVHDGLGIKKLLKSGVEVAIITKRSSEVVTRRSNELGIGHLYQGVENKVDCFNALIQKLSITPESCAYLGDDEPDLEVMRLVAYPVAVANAVNVVKEAAVWITEKEGGFGAAREFCEWVIVKNNGSI